MRPVDSHCHLHAEELNQFRDRAKQEEVEELEFVVDAGLDPDTNRQVLKLANQSSQVVAAVGLHPTRTESFDAVEEVTGQIKAGNPAAVGEIGMDFHHVTDEGMRSRQREVFRRLLEVAERESLPVVCHTRNAEDEVLEVLGGFELEAYLHCFNGRPELVREAVDRGHMIGVGPQLEWSDRAREVARTAPVDNLLLETDSPYIGDSPTDVLSVCDLLGEIKNGSMEGVAALPERLAENALEFFGMGL
jgi:TatD DNase family protein